MKIKYPEYSSRENYPVSNALSFMLYEKNMALILPCKTNVFFGNQAGGLACLQKSKEGALIPFREKIRDFGGGEKRRLFMVDILYNYFIDRKDLAGANIDEITIKFMNDLFSEYSIPFEVDLENKKDSYEAWVWVKIKPQENWEEISKWFGKSAILIWDNTD